MIINKINTTGEMIPICVNFKGKNLNAILDNIRAYKIQQEIVNFCWFTSDDKIDAENFIKSNSVLLEFIPNNDNIAKMPELFKYSLFTFSKMENYIYKLYFVVRLQFCTTFKQFLSLATKTKEFFKCSKFYIWYRFVGNENEIISTSLLDDIKAMEEVRILCEV